jgi:flagellar biosynthesis GTPase FlhF
MNLQTFSAATMTEALAQVKQTMGHDAVILHTRTFSRRYWLGIRRREIVEITAGKGLHVPDRRRRTMRAAQPQKRGLPRRRLNISSPAAPSPLVNRAIRGIWPARRCAAP